MEGYALKIKDQLSSIEGVALERDYIRRVKFFTRQIKLNPLVEIIGGHSL